MKNRIILILIVLLATMACSFNIRDQADSMSVSATPTPTQTVLPTDSPFVVDANEEPVIYPTRTIVGNWNLRNDASDQAKIIGYLYDGDRVQVIYLYWHWALVISNGHRGWVHQAALK